jgi:regulator of sigma E protease
MLRPANWQVSWFHKQANAHRFFQESLFLHVLITLIAFLLTLSILVGFHEFGHYLAARCCGVRVLRFSLGFGRSIFTYRFSGKQNATEWVLASIPLGGYVKLLDGRDQQQRIAESDRSEAFNLKPLWQRSMIVAAGPLANFVLAILLFTAIYLSGAPQVPSFLRAPPENSVAARLDIQAGDRVIGWKELNSVPGMNEDQSGFEAISSWNALRWYLQDAITANKGFVVEVLAPSNEVYIKIITRADLPKMSPDSDPFTALGLLPAQISPHEMQVLKLNPLDALVYASKRVWQITKVSARMMLGFISGETSFKQLGGPVSIADMAGKTAEAGGQAFLAFLALLSISIGLLNLVPLPMLDGGQLLYDAWELVSGKRISISMQERFQKIGFFLLISMTLLALFNDLQRYLLS